MADGAKGGYQIPVEVRHINDEIGAGVFALEDVKAGTLLWVPSLVHKYTPEEAAAELIKMEPAKAHEWLRQAFVLAENDGFLCVNVTDLGRFTNHSSNPNSYYASESQPSVAVRDISAGEEITVDYSGLGSPQWYKDLCAKYSVIPTDEVASRFR